MLELAATVRSAAWRISRSLAAPASVRAVAADEDAASVRARHLVDVARLATIAIAGVVAVVTREASPIRAVVFGALSIHALMRAIGRGRSRTAWLDVGIAAAALMLTGGAVSPYVPYALVTTVWLGFALGSLWGAAAASAIVAASAPSIVALLRTTPQPAALVLTWFALFPLTATAGGMMARIWRSHKDESARVLADANRALADLYRLARAMPAGLELGGVARSIVDDALRATRSHAAAVFHVDAGVPACVASRGDVDVVPLVSAFIDLEAPSAVETSAGCWLLVPLWRSKEELGALAVRCERRDHVRDLAALQPVATHAAIAIENAVLFRRVRELSVDEERQRIARELHDGVAQQLTHLRLELDLTARAAPPELLDSFDRMAKVTERAGRDVRAAIRGLRGGVEGGLLRALESYIAELSRDGGPKIVLDADPGPRLPAPTEQEVFRIVQEAISNSLKHSRASNVVVGLRRRSGMLRVLVQDDGRGYDARGVRRGVGLDAMRERAERIGGRLMLDGTPGDGARVVLEVPAR